MSDRFVVGETTGFLEPGRSLGGHSPNHQKNRRSALPRTIFVADRLFAMRVHLAEGQPAAADRKEV